MEIYINMAEMAFRAAVAVAQWGQECIAARGAFTLALSGGKTPRHFLRFLSAQPVPWRQTYIFWVDERLLPHDDPESNFYLAKTAFLDVLPSPVGGVYPVPVDSSPECCAALYARTILKVFWQRLGKNEQTPVFDCIQLGIGTDGHVGSIFPSYTGKSLTNQLVVPIPQAGLPPFVPRISLSLEIMAAARKIIFLVAGREKARLSSAILQGKHPQSPAGILVARTTRTQCQWYVARQDDSLRQQEF